MLNLNKIIIIVLLLLGASLGVFMLYQRFSFTKISIPTTISELVDFFPTTTNTNEEKINTILGSGDLTNELSISSSLSPFNTYNILISGLTIINTPIGKKVLAMEKKTGNIYEIALENTQKRRITLTSILDTKDVLFTIFGETITAFYTTNDNTYGYITIPVSLLENSSSTTPIAANPVKLPHITNLIINPYTNKLFYFEKFENYLLGYISNPDFSDKQLVFKTPYLLWNISWFGKEKILLNTRPSSKLLGYAYILDTYTKKLERVVVPITGLQTQSWADDTHILYTQNKQGATQTILKNINGNLNSILTSTIIPSDCLWKKSNDSYALCILNNNYNPTKSIDEYYQGKLEKDKSIVGLNLSSGEIISIISHNENKDISKIMAISDRILFFTNTNDELLSRVAD